MLAQAAYVDLVVADRLTADFDFATRSRNEWGRRGQTPAQVDAGINSVRDDFDGVKIHFRLIRRLKGEGRDGFILNGVRRPPEWPRAAARPVALSELHYFRDQFDLADWPSGAICQNPVFASVGERYLIFRDARGRLLQTEVPYTFDGKTGSVTAPAAVPIVSERDPWPATVQAALVAAR